MSDNPSRSELLGLTSEIVSAHAANTTLTSVELTQLIQEVYSTLSHAGLEKTSIEKPRPAVPPKKSIFPDHIICLEDGKKLKMLKRHLKTSYNMTPDEYRERWGLAADYPMVAPNYAKHRSALAKQIGLGTKPRQKKSG